METSEICHLFPLAQLSEGELSLSEEEEEEHGSHSSEAIVSLILSVIYTILLQESRVHYSIIQFSVQET